MSTTPIAQNQYSRFMVEPFSDVDARPLATAFMGAFFGDPTTGAETVYNDRTSQVEIDIEKGDTHILAMMVNRGTNSLDLSRIKSQKEGKFTNLAYGWPLIETTGSIASTELFDRQVGETPYTERSRQDRLTMKAAKIHKEQFKQHITTMEYLCRESLWTGEHPAILGTSNSDLIYDFHRDSGNFITAGTAWTTITADILGDLDSGADKIQQNGGLHGDYGLLCDGAVFKGIKTNTVLTNDADNRRYNFVALGGDVQLPTTFNKYKENGFQPRGRLETNDGRIVWIFTYDLTFSDNFTNPASPSRTAWVPAGKALMFSPHARCDKYFGPADWMPVTSQEAQMYRETFGFEMNAAPTIPSIQNPGVIDPRMFYCFASRGQKSVQLYTQSAPIFPTTHTDAFVVFSGLV